MTRQHSHASKHRITDSALPYTQPFSIQSSCVLSEDYFMTAQVIINPDTDLIRPFVRADGTVEALVLVRGNLSYLHRDPTATSGWSYIPLSGTGQLPYPKIPSDITDLVVGTDGNGVVTGMCVSSSIASLLFFDPTGGTSNAWYTDQYASIPFGGMSRLQAQVDPSGYLYFYAWDDSDNFSLFQPDPDGVTIDVTQLSGPGVNDVADARVLWNGNYDPNTAPAGGILLTNSQGIMGWYVQTGSTSFNTDANFTVGPGTLLWAGKSQDITTTDPTFAYQDPQGDIIFTTTQNTTVGIGSFGAELGAEQIAVWQANGLYSFAMLFNDTINIVTEYGDPDDGTVTALLPLQPGVMEMFSAPADPTQSTLFVLLEDTTLNVLTKDPTTGWTLVPVVQDGPTLQEVDGWRVQLSITDVNGVPVTNTSVSITSDRPIGTWQASGNTLFAAQEPTVFTTDAYGRITFSTPAVELDTAQLTVQVVTDSEIGTASSAVSISPDADVQAFLAGTGSLNTLGTLTAAGLLAAQNTSGTALCPVLANVPSESQTGAANAVISAINQCVQAGQGVTPGTNNIKSFVLDMSQPIPTFSSSTQPNGVQAVHSLADSSWWESVKNDVESFYHSVRHKAVQVASCTANWIKDEADNAYHWAVNLAITLGDDIIGIANYVITDMKSAFHAVTGFFQKLGADIKDAVNWLRHNIGVLIKEAGQNAAQVEQWLIQVPTIVNNQLTEYGNLANGFFIGLEETIDSDIDILLKQFGNTALGSASSLSLEQVQRTHQQKRHHAALDIEAFLPDIKHNGLLDKIVSFLSGEKPSAINTGIQATEATLDIEAFLSDIKHNWLLDKIVSFFSGEQSTGINQDIQAAVDQLAAAATDAFHFVEDMLTLLWDGLKDLFNDKDGFNATTYVQLFTVLKSAVNDLLSFADAVVQMLIDLVKAAMDELGTMLSHQFNEIPLVGGLLQYFGVDDTMSVAHLVSLLLMYPATLANQIKNGTTSSLFPSASTAGDKLMSSLNWGPGLQISAAIGQGFWGFADAVGDASLVNGEEPSGAIGWIDIVSPIILNILQWPGAQNSDETTAAPFANSIDSSGHDGAMIWPIWLLGFVPPIVGLCGQFADYQSSGVQEGDEGSEIPDIGQYFTMTAAIGSTILGSIYNWGTDTGSNAKAAGILGNISNIIAPFATKELAESTEGASAVIKLIVDVAGNIGAAVAMGV